MNAVLKHMHEKNIYRRSLYHLENISLFHLKNLIVGITRILVQNDVDVSLYVISKQIVRKTQKPVRNGHRCHWF